MEWENRSAFVFIKAYPGSAEDVFDRVRTMSGVLCAFLTTGGYDMVAWIDSRGINDAYAWICEVRSWPEVERTSCCPAYRGYWNEAAYRNASYYAWMKIRATDIESPFEYARERDNAAFAVSIPGEYDCFAMFCCQSYEEIYSEVKSLRAKGYEIEFYAPFQSFWANGCEDAWQEYGAQALQLA